MQKINNIILRAATFLAAAVISVSCLEKEDVAKDMQSVMIELSVSSEGMTKSTPSASEKAINSLRIYAFVGERLAGYISRGTIVEGDPFYMDLELPQTGTHDVDFYVVANAEQMVYQNDAVTLSENMTRSQLESIRFTGLASGNALPMYCIQEEQINVSEITSAANTEAGHEGHFILAKKVMLRLSRSLAKISLYAAKSEGSSATPQILDAKILAAGTRTYSYLFPQSQETLSAIAPRPNDRTIHSSALNVEAEIVKDSNEAKDAENYDLVKADVYIPEVNSEDMVIRVEYAMSTGGEIRTGFVYMPQIKRNTHYKVCILISAEGQLIIAADTVVYKDKIIGKPEDPCDAFRTLSSLQNDSHYVATGVCFIKAGEPVRKAFYEVTEVFFKDIPDSELAAYVKTKEPYDKAGGYAMQGLFSPYITGIEGCYFNVVGLPVSELFSMIDEKFGISFEKKNGSAPTILIIIQAIATVTRPSLA